jgi:hypothetical protein
MDLIYAINSVLENDYIDSDENGDTTCEKIEKLIPQYGWEAVQEILLNILLDENRKTRDYEVAAEVFWAAALDYEDISPVNKVIALLYNRLPNDENSGENNLAWSIVCKLKNIDYLSDYDPLKDPEIIAEARRLGY